MLLARTLRLRSALMACALVAAPCAADAQTTVRSGSVVRILAPSVADSLLTGTVLEIDSASLLLAPSAFAASKTVVLRDIERLEVRGPGAPRTLTGAVVGMIAGALAGYGICHAASGSPHSNCQKPQGALIGGVVGLLLGVEIGGHLRGPALWRPVPIGHP